MLAFGLGAVLLGVLRSATSAATAAVRSKWSPAPGRRCAAIARNVENLPTVWRRVCDPPLNRRLFAYKERFIMSNGGGGGKGFLVVLICLAIIGGGGYLIW